MKKCLNCGANAQKASLDHTLSCPQCGAYYAKVANLIAQKEKSLVLINDRLKKIQARREKFTAIVQPIRLTAQRILRVYKYIINVFAVLIIQTKKVVKWMAPGAELILKVIFNIAEKLFVLTYLIAKKLFNYVV